MAGRLRYLAFLSNDPDGTAGFYMRHLGLEELGRSNQGDVSITDGYMNLTFLKARDELIEPDRTIGLHHVGLQVDNMDRATTRYRDVNPRGMIVEEAGGVHFGECRIYDPEGHAVTLSTGDFGVGGDARRIPRVAHIAFNALDPTAIMQFYESLFGFCELDTSYERRRADRKNRFMGDGRVNLAIHPFYNTTLEGHEMRFGVNHFGFLVADMDAKLASFNAEREVAPRPATRPYAEYRVTDPEGNRIDLSYKKGWEVDLTTWVTGADQPA